MELLQQVQEIAKRPGNQVCAECPARHPLFVSLIKPVVVHETVGVFICEGCYKHHFRMGLHFCETKSTEVASDWSKRDVSILHKTGNDYANSFFEANLMDDNSFENDKEIITFDKEEETKLRSAFVKNKYMRRKYFCNEAYQEMRNQRRGSMSTSQKQDDGDESRRASTGSITDRKSKQRSALERNCKERPSSRTASSAGPRTMGRRRVSIAASSGMQKNMIANLYDNPGDDDDEDYSASEGSEVEEQFERPMGGSSRRPSLASTASSNRGNHERRRQRHAQANAPAPSKLESFLDSSKQGSSVRGCVSVTSTADTSQGSSIRRCVSVEGTADTPKPKADEMYSDRVAKGTVDSAEQVRRLKAAKMAKRARRASKQTSNSESRRTSSPDGVREETRISQSLQDRRASRRKSVAMTDASESGRRPSVLNSGLQF